MNNKHYWRMVCLSYFYTDLDLLFTLWCHSLSGRATTCSSPHCKECQTQHSIHSQFSYTMECRETNVLFKISSKLCNTSLEFLQSRSLGQWLLSAYVFQGKDSQLSYIFNFLKYNLVEWSVLVQFICELIRNYTFANITHYWMKFDERGQTVNSNCNVATKNIMG